jgi:hypothetical protein
MFFCAPFGNTLDIYCNRLDSSENHKALPHNNLAVVEHSLPYQLPKSERFAL